MDILKTLKFAISIHALHTEGDRLCSPHHTAEEAISIHALHTEGDTYSCIQRFFGKHFNPRPPYGGRPSMPLSLLDGL